MKRIAKPLKGNDKNKILFGLNWKDLLVACCIFCVLSATWIPLLVNGNIWVGLVLAIVDFLFTAAMVINFGDYRFYAWLFNTVRFWFTKVKQNNIDYVEKIEENTIYLKDADKSIFEFYRIKGKDVSLLNENDFEYLANNLGYFFQNYESMRLLKIDGKINLNKISEYVNSLDNSNGLLDEEIKANNYHINELKRDYVTSNQSKYFISFKKGTNSNIQDKIDDMRKLLHLAELDIVAATDDEMIDIAEKLYFNNVTVDEAGKYLKVKYNDTFELTKDEKNLEQWTHNNHDSFLFRNHFYYKDLEEHFFQYQEESGEWKNCENPFENIKPHEKYMTFIGLKAFPPSVSGCWLYEIFNVKGVDVNFKIITTEEKHLERELTRTIINCEEKFNNLSYNNAVKARLAAEELEGYQELADAIADGQEIKSIECLVKITGTSPKEISKKVRDFAKNLRRQKFEFRRLQFNQYDALKSFFANDVTGLKLNPIECVDNILGYGFPFVQHEIIDDKGLYFGKDENLTPTFIDWKRMDEYKNSSSMILLGKTGSGKSTTAKRIIKNQILSNEYKIFIIDPENEYGELVSKFGGQRILINDPKQIINPFDLNLPKNFDEEMFLDAVNTKIQFLATFYRIIFAKKITEENIEWLIQRTHELLLTNKNKKELVFSDFYTYLEKKVKSDRTHSRKNVLEQFGYYCHKVKGNKAYLWDSKTTIDISNNYIVFEFRDLLAKSAQDAVGTAQMFLVLQYLNNIVLNNRVDNARYINIVVDEAHLLIKPQYLQVVEFLTEMYKRIRKYNGMMTLITQNVSDFYKPEIKSYSENMINNAFYIIAHTIKPQEVPMLNELMSEQGGLKEAEKEFLTQEHKGACLLIYNKARTKINVQM